MQPLRQLRNRFDTVRIAGVELLRHYVTGKPVPLSLTIAPTNRCQGRCTYCDIWKLRQEHERDSGWWIEILNELRKKGSCRVGFTGGEPLLYEGIGEIVQAAREMGMLVSMGTNGLLVPERLDVLQNLHYLVVSVDGPRQTNDNQRFEGSHDAALRAIEVARSQGLTVWATSVVTRETMKDFSCLMGWARQHNLRLNLQLPFHPIPYCGRDNSDLFPERRQIQNFLQLVRPLSRSGGPILNSPAYWDHVERWSELGASIEFTGSEDGVPVHRCSGGQLFFHMEPDGTAYPCAHQVGTHQGRIAESGADLFQALDQASCPQCRTCLSSYAHEQSLLFGLHPSATLTWAREMASVVFRSLMR